MCVYSVSSLTDQLVPQDEDEGGGEEESQASIQQTTHAHAHFHCQTGGFQRRGWVTAKIAEKNKLKKKDFIVLYK